jgi:hypothetical protein
MILNPLRLYRRRQRLRREALEEVQYLRRRHGDEALLAARDQLRRSELTSWGRQVMETAVKLLQSQG